VLVALDSSGIRTLASIAQKDSDYSCPICHESVILKKGQIVIHHYAHFPNSFCENVGESESHEEAKLQILDICKKAGWNADIEVLGDGWRADVLAEHEFTRIAFEIQLSKISKPDLRIRSDIYSAQNIFSYWIFLLPINCEEIRLFLYQIIDPLYCFCDFVNRIAENYENQICEINNQIFFRDLDVALIEADRQVQGMPVLNCHCPNKNRGPMKIKMDGESFSLERILELAPQFPCLKQMSRRMKLCECGTLIHGF